MPLVLINAFFCSSLYSISQGHSLLFNEDDELSSISPSVQNSEPIECNDVCAEHQKEGCSFQSNSVQDSSIADGGVEALAGDEGLFGSVGSDYLHSNYLSSLHLHEAGMFSLCTYVLT